MPALPPVPQVIRLRWIGTDASDLALGTHQTFKYNGPAPSSAQLTALAPTWGNVWATNMAPVVDTGFTLTEVEIIDLSSSTGAVANVPVSHPGTRAGAQLPLNVCFTVAALTNLRRRGGHWHHQLRAGVQTDLLNPTTWTPAFVSAMTTAWQNLEAGVYGALWSGASVSATVGINYYGPPNKTVTSSTGRVKTVSSLLPVPNVYSVTGYQYRTRIGSQRRRLG